MSDIRGTTPGFLSPHRVAINQLQLFRTSVCDQLRLGWGRLARRGSTFPVVLCLVGVVNSVCVVKKKKCDQLLCDGLSVMPSRHISDDFCRHFSSPQQAGEQTKLDT